MSSTPQQSNANAPRYDMSYHTREMWQERTPDTPMTATMAFQKAAPVEWIKPALASRNHETPKEIRLYHGITPDGVQYRMLFIVHDGTVVTTYPYDGHTDSRVEAYVDKMLEQTVYYE